MSRTRRAIASVAIVATLGTGAVSCNPQPGAPTPNFDSVILFIIWNIMAANGQCFLPCLPVQPPTPTTLVTP